MREYFFTNLAYKESLFIELPIYILGDIIGYKGGYGQMNCLLIFQSEAQNEASHAYIGLR